MFDFYLDEQFSIEHNGYLGEIKEGDKTMPFVLRLAKNPKMARALVVLHGHGSNKNFAKFHSDDWTVIVPLDKYGAEGLGSWWLGENGDFFTYRLLQRLISTLKERYTLPAIYFWGSSMGGYGAILHGVASKAMAVYAHISQVKLIGTAYTDGANAKYYEPIFNEKQKADGHIFMDLTKYVGTVSRKKSPVLFLSQNSKDYPHYVRQHFLPLIEACDRFGYRYSVHMSMTEGHKIHLNIAQCIERYFEAEYKNIKNWRLSSIT